MTHIRLQPIDGQDQSPLRIEPGDALRTLAHRQGHQLVIAFQQILHITSTNLHRTRLQRPMNLRRTGVILIALRANVGQYIQPEIVAMSSSIYVHDVQHSHRLTLATSPYLQQHAYNPVDWWPWCPEALALARELNRSILLSIGYSACHWCHVMAHESFQDSATAELMNRRFINIKVDREERPDLDRVYQTAHHLLSRRDGGWPLTVFLSPEDHTPFFAGT